MAAPMRLLKHVFGKEERFFQLLEASAEAGCASVKALTPLLQPATAAAALEQVLAAREQARQASSDIEGLLCEGAAAAMSLDDIEKLNRALHRIPKGAKKFAERHALCAPYLDGVSFATETRMLEEAADLLRRMVAGLRAGSNLVAAQALNVELQKIEGKADDQLVAVLDTLYRGRYELQKAVMIKDLHELLERVFDRFRDAGNLLLQVAFKRS